jgi:hypothetical protein
MGEGDGAADGVVGRSVLIETQQDLAVALERLRRRDPGASPGECRTLERPGQSENSVGAKNVAGFIEQERVSVAPADVALAAFHLSRYVRAEAEAS